MKRLALFSIFFAVCHCFAAESGELYEGQREKAANPVRLHLFPEPGRLLGWVAGAEDPGGEKVLIDDGETEHRVDLDAERRFHWEGEAKQLTIRYRDEEQAVTLPPKDEDHHESIAFFVVDRAVCRPQTALHFAAFLREPDGQGSFRPVKNAEVSVLLTSKAKGIRAATLKLKSDDLGRVTGDYTFSKADPRDDYSLKVKGFSGAAPVKLAEFRKAKVRLDISHERPDAETLKLKFRALDFLEKPVKATDLRLEAKVVRETDSDPRLWGLDPKQHATWEDRDGHWYALSAEQQALSIAGEEVSGNSHGFPVHTVSKNLEMGEDGEGEFFLMLDPAWKHDHVLEVKAGIIDANEREQRASTRIPLGPDADPDFELDLDKSEVFPGSSIKISVNCPEGRTLSLLTFRLKARVDWNDRPPENSNPFLYGSGEFLQRGISRLHSRSQFGARIVQPQPRAFHRVAREFHSISHPRKLKGDAGAADGPARYRATLSLGKPGAYVVQALAQDEAGQELAVEKTIVVLPEDRANGIFLELETDRVKAGEPLRGRVHSRFEGARILLALRDGNGVRLLHPLTAGKDAAAFEIPLPKGLTLGCELTARYSDNGRALHFHRRPFAVEPRTSRLEIASKIPATVEPGSEVTLEFSVDRKEKTALVVSVYDQSLLGIAPDPGIDGPSLFHADVRVENDAVDAVLRNYLGDLTLNRLKIELSEFSRQENGEEWRDAVPLLNQLNNLRTEIERKYLRDVHLPLIFAWRGASIDLDAYSDYAPYARSRSGWSLRNLSEADMDRPLLELIRRHDRSYESWLVFSLAGENLQFHVESLRHGWSQMMFGQAGGGVSLGSGGFGAVTSGRARGDAMGRDFWGAGEIDISTVSGNASRTVSGQSFHSHMPTTVAMAAVPGAQNAGADPAMTIRRDFSDSAFFDARVQTDAEGKAAVRFKLPDSLTNWRVVVTGVSDDLAIGRHTASFRTYKPVMVWPMLSQGFTSGDRVKIFALVHNHTKNDEAFTVSASTKNGRFDGEPEKSVEVPANSSAPVYFDYEAGDAGFTEILMTARCAAGQDASLKRLPVFPCTAEKVITRSGFAKDKVSFEIPEGVDLANSRLDITISPSLAGDMFDSLDYLVSYPHGCVEQTMSRFLPLIKVTQILERFEIEDKELRERASVFAEAGIKRLLELQKEDGGWGWQGNSGTHEMMTPYALLGLIEAEKAGFEIPSDDAVEKGMKRLEGFIGQMRSDRQSADRIYCMWVYRHHRELPADWWRWLDTIVDRTLSVSRNRSDLLSDYAAALALEMAAKTDRKPLAGKLARLLGYRARGENNQAYWTTANFSRWGNDRFEITAAVLKAFAAHDPDHPLVPRVLGFFANTKRGNRWNSTKDTAMILYALCDYLSTRQMEAGDGGTETSIACNGEEYRILNESWRPKTISIEGGALDPDHPGAIEFLEADPSNLYRIVFRYWKNGTEIEAADEGVAVTRTFQLIDPEGTVLRDLKNGDSVPRGALIRSILQARSDSPLTYALAANPKPSCAEFSPVKSKVVTSAHVLKEEKASGVLWHHENPGGRALNNAIAYRAELAGEFLVPPAYVELMYDTATRGHSGSFRLIVTDPGAKPVALK